MSATVLPQDQAQYNQYLAAKAQYEKDLEQYDKDQAAYEKQQAEIKADEEKKKIAEQKKEEAAAKAKSDRAAKLSTVEKEITQKYDSRNAVITKRHDAIRAESDAWEKRWGNTTSKAYQNRFGPALQMINNDKKLIEQNKKTAEYEIKEQMRVYDRNIESQQAINAPGISIREQRRQMTLYRDTEYGKKRLVEEHTKVGTLGMYQALQTKERDGSATNQERSAVNYFFMELGTPQQYNQMIKEQEQNQRTAARTGAAMASSGVRQNFQHGYTVESKNLGFVASKDRVGETPRGQVQTQEQQQQKAVSAFLKKPVRPTAPTPVEKPNIINTINKKPQTEGLRGTAKVSKIDPLDPMKTGYKPIPTEQKHGTLSINIQPKSSIVSTLIAVPTPTPPKTNVIDTPTTQVTGLNGNRIVTGTATKIVEGKLSVPNKPGSSYIGYDSNGTPIQGPVEPSGYTVTIDGKSRTFKTKETAETYISRTQKPPEKIITPAGSIEHVVQSNQTEQPEVTHPAQNYSKMDYAYLVDQGLAERQNVFDDLRYYAAKAERPITNTLTHLGVGGEEMKNYIAPTVTENLFHNAEQAIKGEKPIEKGLQETWNKVTKDPVGAAVEIPGEAALWISGGIAVSAAAKGIVKISPAVAKAVKPLIKNEPTINPETGKIYPKRQKQLTAEQVNDFYKRVDVITGEQAIKVVKPNPKVAANQGDVIVKKGTNTPKVKEEPYKPARVGSKELFKDDKALTGFTKTEVKIGKGTTNAEQLPKPPKTVQPDNSYRPTTRTNEISYSDKALSGFDSKANILDLKKLSAELKTKPKLENDIISKPSKPKPPEEYNPARIGAKELFKDDTAKYGFTKTEVKIPGGTTNIEKLPTPPKQVKTVQPDKTYKPTKRANEIDYNDKALTGLESKAKTLDLKKLSKDLKTKPKLENDTLGNTAKPKPVKSEPGYKPKGKNEGGFKDTFKNDTKQASFKKSDVQSKKTSQFKEVKSMSTQKTVLLEKPKVVPRKLEPKSVKNVKQKSKTPAKTDWTKQIETKVLPKTGTAPVVIAVVKPLTKKKKPVEKVQPRTASDVYYESEQVHARPSQERTVVARQVLVTKPEQRVTPKGVSKQTPKISTKITPKQTPKLTPKQTPKITPIITPKITPKQSAKPKEKLFTPTPQKPKQKAQPKSKFKPRTKPRLMNDTPLVPRPKRTVMVPIGALPNKRKRQTRSTKSKKGKDFLGSSRTNHIEGMFDRSDIITGDKRTAKQVKEDKKSKFKTKIKIF